jgi:hypothetical protein
VEGKSAPYELDVHVPLVVIGPGVPAHQTRDHLAGNIDLAPTFAAMAGVTPPNYSTKVDGRSLLPLLGSDPPCLNMWRQSLLLSFWVDNSNANSLPRLDPVADVPVADVRLLEPPEPGDLAPAPGIHILNEIRPANLPTYSGLRLAYYKYVEYYQTGEKELYDLRTDPDEMQNLASTANPNLLAELSSRLHTMKTCAGDTCRATEDLAFVYAPPEDCPTSAELLSFTATRAAKGISLAWETASEADTLGFNLYRAKKVDGPRTQVNEDLIPAQLPGSAAGVVYRYKDLPVEGSGTYFYWLEKVDVSGGTGVFGPVQVGTK